MLTSPAPALPATYRVPSIDILRGLVMIIMALDHTRDFFHITALTADPLDPGNTTLPLYFTRWITHFCAPTFVLLSGISAYLSAQKKSRAAASNFLLKRGAWLILVEVTLVTFGITYNPFFNFIILQVIWAIGFSMVVLGLLSRISEKLVLITGLLLFFGHNILNHLTLPTDGVAGRALQILFTSRGGILPLGPDHVLGIFYAALPWTGIMLIGYAMGKLFYKNVDPHTRRKYLLLLGFGMILLFVLLRFINVYGNPEPAVWGEGFRFNLLTFLNTSKYPPSLQYACMTLGPALILLALWEKASGRWAEVLSVYGRVPFFYYILHFYLLHLLLVAAYFATGGSLSEAGTIPFFFRPAEFGFGLPVVYLIWLTVVAVLYLPCRWFGRYKATHRQWWLGYL